MSNIFSLIFNWVRYILVVCLAVVLIWWGLQPPGQGRMSGTSEIEESAETAPPIVQCNGTTMGTVPFCVKATDTQVQEKELLQTVQDVLDLVDSTMSTFRTDSEVSRFNQSNSTDWFPVSPETAQVVQIALDVSELTQGTFDITVGPLVNRWGFGPEEYSTLPAQEEIDEILQSVGYRYLAVQTNPPSIRKDVPHLKIDLSGIAKGFAVDQVAAALEKKGIKNYMIEVGGETRTKGEKSPDRPWTIGIEIPTPSWVEEPKIQCKVHLGSQSMATSGDYQNFIDDKGIRFSHIIDPRTGWPVEKSQIDLPDSRQRLGSLSVVDSTCVRADALTKGFYVLGVEEGLKFANDHGIAVLFLLREETGTRRGGPGFTVREVKSEAFKKNVKIVE
ncbi:MAG: FAD:protein FMN transferase [Planctomycetaceae bacterium]|nr:FAD:protein FMN transferase [Planctomycetaceae bacterium]